MTPPADEVPIACTLTGGDFQERVAWIRQLNQEGLRGHRRDAASIELCYAPAVRDRVLELVRRERACCAFLGFDVEDAGDGVRLTITVPERARAAANELLQPFLP